MIFLFGDLDSQAAHQPKVELEMMKDLHKVSA
jgi:hypothetical protein